MPRIDWKEVLREQANNSQRRSRLLPDETTPAGEDLPQPQRRQVRTDIDWGNVLKEQAAGHKVDLTPAHEEEQKKPNWLQSLLQGYEESVKKQNAPFIKEEKEHPSKWTAEKDPVIGALNKWDQSLDANKPLNNTIQTVRNVSAIGAKGAAGFTRGATLGAYDPDTGKLGIPLVSNINPNLRVQIHEPLGQAMTEGPNHIAPGIANNKYIGIVPEIAASLAPVGRISQGIGWLAQLGRGAELANVATEAPQVLSTGQKLLNVGGRLLHAGATGAVTNTIYVHDNPNIPKDAAVGAMWGVGTQAGLETINVAANALAKALTPLGQMQAYRQLRQVYADWAYGTGRYKSPEEALIKTQGDVDAIVNTMGKGKPQNLTPKEIKEMAKTIQEQAPPPVEPSKTINVTPQKGVEVPTEPPKPITPEVKATPPEGQAMPKNEPLKTTAKPKPPKAAKTPPPNPIPVPGANVAPVVQAPPVVEKPPKVEAPAPAAPVAPAPSTPQTSPTFKQGDPIRYHSGGKELTGTVKTDYTGGTTIQVARQSRTGAYLVDLVKPEHVIREGQEAPAPPKVETPAPTPANEPEAKNLIDFIKNRYPSPQVRDAAIKHFQEKAADEFDLKGNHTGWGRIILEKPKEGISEVHLVSKSSPESVHIGTYQTLGPAKENLRILSQAQAYAIDHRLTPAPKEAAPKAPAVKPAPKPAPKAEVKKTPAAVSYETKSKPSGMKAQSLRTQADAMTKTIEAKRNPAIGQQNPTARRANIAAGMAADAERMEHIQGTMRRIADAVEEGTLPKSLEKVTKKTQIEALHMEMRMAKDRALANEDYYTRRDKVFQPEHAQHAKLQGMASKRDLESMLKLAPGKAEDNRTILSIIGKDGRFTTPKEADALDRLVKAAEAKGSKDTDHVKNAVKEFRRFVDMGITNDKELAQALKDFHPYTKQAPRETPAERKIKEAERGLLGTKIPGYFPTPKTVVERMMEEAGIESKHRVLEPSAGKGNIADAIKELGVKPDVLEINHTLAEILGLKGYNVQTEDFLGFKDEKGYDRIVQNPPFEGGQDIEHVKHAYELLKPGGRLVSIMGEGPFFRSDSKSVNFRQWLEKVGGIDEKLPEGAFKSSERPTGVNTRMVVIDKATVEQQLSTDATKRANAGPSLNVVSPAVAKILQNRFAKPEKKNPFEFANAEAEAEFQEAHGVTPPTMREKLGEGLVKLVHMATRVYEHLPNTAEFEPLRTALLRLQKAKGVSMDRAALDLQGVTSRLDPRSYGLFERVIPINDFAEELEVNPENPSIPAAFTPSIVRLEKAAKDAQVEANPLVKEALKKHYAITKEVVDNLIAAAKKAGVKLEGKFDRKQYFRHMVLSYANMQGGVKGPGKRLRSPEHRGYTQGRSGSMESINTDYLQATFESLAQMLEDTQIYETIALVDKDYNIMKQLEAKARAMNEKKIIALSFESPAVDKALKKFRQKIGFAFLKLGEMADKGELWSNKEYEDVVQELAQNYRKKIDPNNEALGEIEVENGKLWRYLSDVMNNDRPGANNAGAIFKAIQDRKSFTKNALGQDFKTYEDLMPEGYEFWQPLEGSMFFKMNTVPERIANALYQGLLESMNITKDDLKKIIALGGPKRGFVIKSEIANTLNELSKVRQDNWITKTLKTITTGFKINAILTIHRFFKYNFRNCTSDGEWTAIGNPAAFPRSMNATKELFNVIIKHGGMSQTMREWYIRGGMDSVQSIQELGDVSKLPIFKHLFTPKGEFIKMPFNAWKAYWDNAMKYTQLREGILRYANFVEYLEQMRANNGIPKNFGASDPKLVMALDNWYDRAFMLSNDLCGAYDRTSVFGQTLSNTAYPFWRYQEVNMKRYIQFIKNQANEGNAAQAIGKHFVTKSPRLAYNIGKLVIKLVGLYGLIYTYNHLIHPDDEADLPKDIQESCHIDLGRNPDGTVRYFTNVGALSDALDWFGLEVPLQSASDLLNNRKTLMDVVKEMALSPVKKFISGVNPAYKLLQELASKTSFFPDPFHPRPIRNRGLYLAQQVGFDEEFKAAMGLPSRGLGRAIANTFYYEIDPKESAYNTVQALKRDYLKGIGEERGGGYADNNRSNAAYNLKLALRYKDEKAIKKYMDLYLEYGGDRSKFDRSLATLDPLFGVKKYENDFVNNYLTEDERYRLDLAYEFYDNVLAAGDNLEFPEQE